MSDGAPQKKYDDLKAEVQMLDSKISLIAQKIRMIEKNEDIIGRTIVVHNDKLHKLESAGPVSQGGPAGAGGESNSSLAAEVEALKKQVAELKEQAATKAEVSELHYTLDTINPLDFVTLKQARKLVAEELDKRTASG
jgi:prefoldin subunit 5